MSCSLLEVGLYLSAFFLMLVGFLLLLFSSSATFSVAGIEPENSKPLFSSLFFSSPVLLYLAAFFACFRVSFFGVLGMIQGGSKKFVAVERKSFDMVVEGRGKDILRITYKKMTY